VKKIYAVTVILLAVSVSSFGQDSEVSFAQNKEKVIAFLYDTDERRTKYGSEIISIEEFNFGIPGGINWLVEWEGEQRIYPYIYVIDYSVDIGVWEIRLREFIIGSISLNNRQAAIVAEPLEETALSVVEDSNKSKKLIFIIARIIGVIALVAGIIFVAVGKRKVR
jgi:hypothetical protein